LLGQGISRIAKGDSVSSLFVWVLRFIEDFNKAARL
jgi:hypothetical protein